MKILIAGSRDIFPEVSQIDLWLKAIPATITEVVSGGAKGVDLAGEAWAKAHGVPVRQFLPDWTLGKKAGPIRNRLMVDYAGGALLIWDGESRGTKSTLDYLREKEKNFVLKILPTAAQRNENAIVLAADRVAQLATEWHRQFAPNERHMACSHENPCDLWIALQVYTAIKQ